MPGTKRKAKCESEDEYKPKVKKSKASTSIFNITYPQANNHQTECPPTPHNPQASKKPQTPNTRTTSTARVDSLKDRIVELGKQVQVKTDMDNNKQLRVDNSWEAVLEARTEVEAAEKVVQKAKAREAWRRKQFEEMAQKMVQGKIELREVERELDGKLKEMKRLVSGEE